jgi:hypothetical protein
MEEKEEIFSGKALEVRFPDMTMLDEKGNEYLEQIKFLTFPNWIHNVLINNKVYQVLGKDLQIGMPVAMGGALFPIISIDEQLCQGKIIRERHPIGYPGDPKRVAKYSFKRIIKDEVDYWVVEEEKKLFTGFNKYSEEKLLTLDKEDLIKYTLSLQKYTEGIEQKLKNSLQNIEVLKNSNQTKET